MRRWLWVWVLAALACHPRPSEFDSALTRAAESHRRGAPDEARKHYRRAFAEAQNRDEEVEALYRALLLTSDPEAARGLVLLSRRYPEAARAPRCLLDAGRIYERLERPDQALGAFTELLERFPSSASAPSALGQILKELRRRDPTGKAERDFIAARRARLAPLGEELLFREAEALEPSSVPSAIVAYENVASVYPLPEGRYADEALLRAARLRRGLGDIEGALEVLKTMMDADEKSLLVGSYTRGSYAEAAYVRASILRDDQKDSRAAAKAFELFPSQFPHSRLRDDALKAAADIHRANGETGAACATMKRLESVDPGSRYRRLEAEYCHSERP